MDRTPDARIYKKQIKNNQFSNQLSSLHVNPVPVCSPINVWDNQNSTQQSYTLVPTALANAYQQLIPLANSLQNGNLPISYNAQQNQLNRKITRSAKYRQNKWFQKNQNRYVPNQSTHNQYSHSQDLRKKLSVRRKSATYIDNEEDGYNNRESGSWNDKNHRDDSEWEDTTIQMNLAPLKLLTSSGSDMEQWYIVVDTDVILNNFTYLNNMATSDPDCHLLIPHHVMLELHSLASESNNIQERRIYRFLNEQIQCGLAMLGEEVAGEGPVNLAIMTCVKLSTENNHVILISNNPDILKYKSNTKYIHVFTIQDVKHILAKKSSMLFRADSPTLALKITVPNDVALQNLYKTDDFSDTSFRRDISYSDDRISTPKNEPGFPEYIESEHQISPKPMSEDVPHTLTSANFMIAQSTYNKDTRQSPNFSHSPPKQRIIHRNITNMHLSDTNEMTRSVEHIESMSRQSPLKPSMAHQNRTNTDVGDRKIMSRSVNYFETFNSQSSPKKSMAHQNCTNTYVGDSEMMTRPMDPFQTVCQNPPKTRKTLQEEANTDGGDRIILANSVEHTKTTCSQSPIKQWNTMHKELFDSNVVKRTYPEESLVAYSPSKSTRSSDISTKSRNKNALRESHNKSPSILIKQCGNEYSGHVDHSLVKADDVSFSSSSASGHVSLDTINMKRIISMNRLTTAHNIRAKSVSSNTSKKTIKSPEIMQQINRDTSASRSSYDNDSETTRTKNIAPNITVEETSLSAISNSESSYSEKAKSSIKKDVKKVSLRSVVMFNVGCQSMEDVLKMRCDEWVFRFVQIMEEVLRVKLQEKIPSDNKEYPAPRDLQEAARSVIKKFSNNFSVVEAANKLSFILYKNSDEDGKIAVNIEPSDYMEMYSYGVFLVETFQDMSVDCKEINCMKEGIIKSKENHTDSCSCYEVKAASDSLKKLLYDIQNANLESFVDHTRDISADNTIPDSEQYDFEFDEQEEIQEPEESEHCGQQVDSAETVANKYNLRSQKRKSESFEDEEVPPKVTMSEKGFESSFFNSLQLQRTEVIPDKDSDTHEKDMNPNKQTVDNEKGTEINTIDKFQKGDLNNLQIHFSKDLNTAKSQSKVVCNFTINDDIERKVKARQDEAEYEEYSDNEEISKTSEKSVADEESIEINESHKKFQCFMGRLVRRLGETFTHVKLLCDEYVKMNELSDINTRKELRKKMEMASVVLGNIHDSLQSISNRELQKNGKSIRILLEIAEVKDYIPDDKLCLEYRNMIDKCKEKVEEFNNTIRNLLKMVRV